MKHKIRKNRKKLLKTFIQYGLHLWFIIFICNIAAVYAIHFFLFASTDTPNITSPTPKPGPVISLNLVLPGISSTGGNLKPLHPVREISVNLYGPDLNTSDNKVKPSYSIKTKVNFDADPNSRTYTQFINPHVDLGDITSGNYQIAIHASQILLSAIKEPGSSSLGGKIYYLSGGTNNKAIILPTQIMISGDIYPAGNNNNIMDINDYNMLTNCFSNNINASKCPNASEADLDDNGIVDGVDYNIMLLNFRSLKSLGYQIPTIVMPTVASTTIAIPVSNIQKQTISPIQKQTKSSGSAVFIILFVILLILGIAGFILFKLHLLKLSLLKSLIKGLIKSLPVSQNNKSTDESSAKEKPDMIEKSVYLKKISVDSKTNGTWVTLADDNGVIPGLYPEKDVLEGFVKIKGTMKTDSNNKQYILISEIKEEK